MTNVRFAEPSLLRSALLYGGAAGAVVLATAMGLALFLPAAFSDAGLASPETAFGYGHEFELRGIYREAESYYRAALDQGFPNEARGWQCRLHLANVLFRQGRWHEAAAEYARVPEQAYARSLESLRNRARTHLEAKDFANAVHAGAAWHEYSLAHALHSEAAAALLLQGDAHLLGGNPSAALRAYEEAAESPLAGPRREAGPRMALAHYAAGGATAAEAALDDLPRDPVSRVVSDFLRTGMGSGTPPADLLEHLRP